jgi:hypothetical protein
MISSGSTPWMRAYSSEQSRSSSRGIDQRQLPIDAWR